MSVPGNQARPARMIMSGSASPWPIYAVLLIVGLVLININQTITGSLGKTVLGVRPLPDLAFIVVFTLVWYFAAAPVWAIVKVRAARASVPAAELIRIVRLDASTLRWLAAIRHRTRAASSTNGTILIATPDELQIWVGPNSELMPAAVVKWADIASVGAGTGRTRIEVHLADGKTTLELHAAVGRMLRPAIAAGRARQTIVDELEALRRASAAR